MGGCPQSMIQEADGETSKSVPVDGEETRLEG